MTQEINGTPIKCPNLRCRHKWIYKGKSKFYATCPQCYNKVRLPTAPQKSETKEDLPTFNTHNSDKKTRPKVRPKE